MRIPEYMKWAEDRRSEIKAIKKYLKQNIHQLNLGLYFTRNIVDDPMELTLNGKYTWLWTCWEYGYTEVFGLNSEEQSELAKWYKHQVEIYEAKEEENGKK